MMVIVVTDDAMEDKDAEEEKAESKLVVSCGWGLMGMGSEG